jgi:DNA-binding transcriptional LysR family regulator
MDRLQNIETFVKVAQTQSFAEAARQLRVAKSVVTMRVKQLEDFLGGSFVEAQRDRRFYTTVLTL